MKLRRIPALALLLAGLGVAGSAAAQDAPPSLRVRVTDASTRRPLPYTQLSVGSRRLVTDSAGTAFLSGLPAGVATLEAERLGYATERARVELAPGKVAELQMVLHPQAVALPGVAASARGAPRTQMLRDFYKRVEGGSGRYFTREQIDRQKPHRLTDLLRAVPSITLIATPIGDSPVMNGEAALEGRASEPQSRKCTIRYFLDGTPFDASHDGQIGVDIRPSEVEGIEVYRNGATVPARFRRAGPHCGTILIWKRERI